MTWSTKFTRTSRHSRVFGWLTASLGCILSITLNLSSYGISCEVRKPESGGRKRMIMVLMGVTGSGKDDRWQGLSVCPTRGGNG